MKFINKIKDKIRVYNEAEHWKREAERYRKEYKRELLMNQAYSHAILQAVLADKIDHEQQKLLYDLVNHEMEIIYNKLL